jgi:homogentisate 1,2-dioxygenase
MVDTRLPLDATRLAESIEDVSYADSWRGAK